MHLAVDLSYDIQLIKQQRRIGMIPSPFESIDVFISTGITFCNELDFIQDVCIKECMKTKNET